MENQVTSNAYNSYFKNYTRLIEEKEVVLALKNATKKLKHTFSLIDETVSFYAYAEGKWTVNELMLHLIDTERILLFRALSFARGETTALPGFDEERYASNSNANNRSLKSIKKEFLTVRKATLSFYKNITPTILEKEGVAGGNTLSVAYLGFIIAGHQQHHLNILKNKYLTK